MFYQGYTCDIDPIVVFWTFAHREIISTTNILA